MASPAASAIIGIAVAAGQTAVQSDQARSQRNAAERFRRRRQMLEQSNALQAQRIAMQEISARAIADSDAAAVEIEANRREKDRAVGTATVIAGETGAFGGSYDALVGEFERQQAEFEGAVVTNLAIKRQFGDLNRASTQVNSAARLLNSQTQSIPRPNYANYAVGGLSTGLSIFGSIRKRQQ